MGDQGVDQGAVRVARRRVDHQARRLVDDDEMGVLVDHLERQGLAVGRAGRTAGTATSECLAGFDPMGRRS